MNESLQIINPIEYPGWDELLLSNSKCSFFQTSSWAKVLSESYNYKPLFFIKTKKERLSILISVMEVNSILTGKRGISLPFTDYCPIIIDNTINLKTFKEQVFRFGQNAGWKNLELRGDNLFFAESQAAEVFVNHTLALENGEKEIFDSFKSSTKRNIRRAIKEGIRIEISNSAVSVKEFYRLNCITTKR